MQADKTTIADLTLYSKDEEPSIFQWLNFTQTNDGRDFLYNWLSKPKSNIEDIKRTQDAIKQLQNIQPKFPTTITNGTIMVIEKFYETPLSSYPERASSIDGFFYKLFSKYDYSITKYSLTHFFSFLKDILAIQQVLKSCNATQIFTWTEKISLLLKKTTILEILQRENAASLSTAEILRYAHYLKHHYKQEIKELIAIYVALDAYLSLAKACNEYQLFFPKIKSSSTPFIDAEQLFHPLLNNAVSYDFALNKDKNFLFLTGANMAGKSTFIKAVGVSVYLAHLGMAVPAKKMEISLFDGLLSNIQVVDNLTKGESYFFNEVQRIKSTIEKISDGKNWLILIDELFKGTNVQDAMKCSTTVIEGLHKMNNALFVLSTHLYEIAEDLKRHNNMVFKYFETEVKNDQLLFSYHLKEGISNDRLGYLILKKEGVVDMLKNIS